MIKQFSITQIATKNPSQTEVMHHRCAVEFHKNRLREIIVSNIKTRGWNQKEAAEYFGVSQSSMSYICSGKTRNFSMDTMLKMLSSLGYTCTVSVN